VCTAIAACASLLDDYIQDLVMHLLQRPRPWLRAATVGLLAAVAAGCDTVYPNSTFHSNTEFNAAVDHLWNQLLWWGTLVFIAVEAALVWVIIRFRRKPNTPDPKPVHGNTTLEIVWTAIPAVILVFIAIPTVKTIFQTQAKAPANALTVEVIGHQWWWEFRYPEQKIVTANELYLPIGRTVNFALTTKDVLHSFWIPQLGGKRDLITNRVNHLWFTVDSSLASASYNGACAEFCGPSHANMRFRVYTVTADEFVRWSLHQARPAVFPTPAAPAAPAPTAVSAAPGATPLMTVALQDSAAPAPAAPEPAPFVFPREKIPAHVMPTTPLPPGLAWTETPGDAERGRQLYSRSSCIGCHAIAGNPMSAGIIGPNLTHIGTRHTLAAGLFPNDTKHLALWIKNARLMKPGSIMPALGKGEYDPIMKMKVTTGGLSDQDIADIVAYLQALK
jgi:cytochrome c oxidase subunit II